MTGIDVLSFAERLATDADADADAPTLEETLELCASDVQEKKLVGALLATKVLARVAERQRASTCDAIAKALGAKFLNALLKPAAADADAESRLNATMRTSLGPERVLGAVPERCVRVVENDGVLGADV